MIQKLKMKGFTLIEMMLVMVIISVIIVMAMGYIQQRTFQIRIDRASGQMQQILNAGLAYYINNGTWPSSLTCLQASGTTGCTVRYLPPNVVSPWAEQYIVQPAPGTPSPLFYVYTLLDVKKVNNPYVIATTLAGRLPLSYTSTTGGSLTIPSPTSPCTQASKSCWVAAAVNIPGQNLNNASAVNFAGVFHNGACVPEPKCPVDSGGNTMTAQIIVAPISVSGMNDAPTTVTGGTCSATDTSGCQANLYPLNSFTAYSTQTGTPPVSCAAAGGTPAAESCAADETGTALQPTTGRFWRVCLSTVTERGMVAPNSNPWGQIQGTIMAMTRCVPSGQAATASGFRVWSDK